MPLSASSNNLMLVVAVVFVAIAIILIFLAIKDALADSRLIKARLEGRWKTEGDNSILKHNQAFDSFANHLTLPDDEQISKIRAQLARAGFYGTSSVKYFYAIRILSLVVPLIIFTLSWTFVFSDMEPKMTIGISCGLILAGFMLPQIILRMLEKRRTMKIRRGFPDMLDLTVASIEAGLGMDAALLRVAEEIGSRNPPLKINLDILNMELRAGRERHAGMLNFAKRVNLEEAKALAVMLRQAEQMGASLGKSLRTFAEEMRNKRMMKAEEKAMALPAKLTVPLIIFIFPSIMAMLLIPAGIRLVEGLG